MPTLETLVHHLSISALNDVSAEAEKWLNAPKPPPGATGPYARNWFAHWTRILLLDLGRLDTTVTREGAAEILGTDTAMITAVLAQLRRDDEEEPTLGAADFARITQAN